jgi:putative NIF3 family GTP cyclohydrolase 1 type 2
VMSAHTNLDAAAGGRNDIMAALLGMTDAAPLRPAVSDESVGLGRVGRIEPTTLEGLAAKVASAFGGTGVHYSGDPWGKVGRIACCTGSGGSLIGDARAAEAEAYVTSDLKYHDADRAEGLPLVALPHAAAERVAMRRWTKTLQRALASEKVEVRFADAETDPWQSVA